MDARPAYISDPRALSNDVLSGDLIVKKLLIICTLFFCLTAALPCYQLTLVSEAESLTTARNWLSFISRIPLDGKAADLSIRSRDIVFHRGRVLCIVYHFHPRGHAVISAFKEFAPVKSFSVVSDFDPESQGYELAVLEELKAGFDFLEGCESGEIKALDLSLADNQSQWLKLSRLEPVRLEASRMSTALEKDTPGISRLGLKDGAGTIIRATVAEPLLKTKWGQGNPYWYFCPIVGGKRCYVGCTAAAVAQIMKYYEWPAAGKGGFSYYWAGGGRVLSADFSDSYDWANMADETADYTTVTKRDAVAELCYEVGVSAEMDYGTDGSAASVETAADALKKYFNYSPELRVIFREDYPDVQTWFNLLKAQRDSSRPSALAIYTPKNEGHAVVIDGYMISDGMNLVHINMGWEGNYDSYYALDNILDFTKTIWQHAVVNIMPVWAQIQIDKTSLSFSGVEGQADPAPQIFKIRNSASGIYNYVITADASWIKISPASGSAGPGWTDITVFPATSALLEGSYTATVTITSRAAGNSPQTLPVALTLAAPPIYAPLNVSGAKVENRSVTQREYIDVLKWAANPLNRNIAKYRIYRIEDGGENLLAEVGNSTFEYLHRRVEKDRAYKYGIVAVNLKDRAGTPAIISIK